jgi:hypothetical protein
MPESRQLKDDLARDHLQKVVIEPLSALARPGNSWFLMSVVVDAGKHLSGASIPLGSAYRS